MTLTAPAASAASSSLNPATCQNISRQTTEGRLSGTFCTDGVLSGEVEDLKADGRCPYARFTLNNGLPWDTPRVGPKGAKKSFYFSGLWGNLTYEVRWAYC